MLAREPVTVPTLEAHLRAHVGGANGWTTIHVAGIEATTAAIVAELTPPGANGRHPNVRFLLGTPCHSVFVPVFVGQPLGDPPAWEDLAVFTTDDRPRLDALEVELEADAVDDPGWNTEAWRRVRARDCRTATRQLFASEAGTGALGGVGLYFGWAEDTSATGPDHDVDRHDDRRNRTTTDSPLVMTMTAAATTRMTGSRIATFRSMCMREAYAWLTTSPRMGPTATGTYTCARSPDASRALRTRRSPQVAPSAPECGGVAFHAAVSERGHEDVGADREVERAARCALRCRRR